MANNTLHKLFVAVILLFLPSLGCASHHTNHHAHFTHCLYAYHSPLPTCFGAVIQPTVTQTVPVTNFATVTNTAHTYTFVTPSPILLTEMSTLTVSPTVSTITPSTTVTRTTTNTVTSTPPIVSTTTSITSTILTPSTTVVMTTITTTSTSSIISTKTSRIPMCN